MLLRSTGDYVCPDSRILNAHCNGAIVRPYCSRVARFIMTAPFVAVISRCSVSVLLFCGWVGNTSGLGAVARCVAGLIHVCGNCRR